MSGTIVVDRIESDASYASSINIASPIQISNTITGNVNFDSGTLFVDSVNNRVGIGTQNPVVGLQVTNPSGGGQIRVVSSGGNILQLISDSSEASIRAVAAVPLTFRTSNEERMSIDASGRVTMPYQPFFYALRSGDQSGYNAESQGDVVVIYNNAGTNIGSHYNTSTGKFTAPINGIYMFVAGAYSATQSFSQSWLVLNGSRAPATDWHTNSTGNFSVNATMIQLSTNDTVGFHAYAGGATNATITASTQHTYFRGYLLG